MEGGGRADGSFWLDARQILILFKTFLQMSLGRLTLRYHLRLEDVYGCPYDFLEVFDGRQGASSSLGRFCAGAELSFLSSANIMTVVFRSDAVVTNTGFYARYKATQPDEREGGRYPEMYFAEATANLGPFP